MSAAQVPSGLGEAVPAGLRRTIPYDYPFRFQLTGEPQTTHRETVTVSIESPFTAVAIGYGVIPRVEPVTFGPKFPDDLDEDERLALASPASFLSVAGVPARSGRIRFRDVRLSHVLNSMRRVFGETEAFVNEDVEGEILSRGFALNPALGDISLFTGTASALSVADLQRLFVVGGAPAADVAFLYALFDDGTGRAFQNDPILNIAGLGGPDGKRPFRYFATPIEFAQRTVIRLEITEVTRFQGELHVALHGYKVLGGAGSPTAFHRRVRRARR